MKQGRRSCRTGDGIVVDGNDNGGMHIEGWDKDTIRLRAYVSVWAPADEAAREINDGIQIVPKGVVSTPKVPATGPETGVGP